jgi:hypothetical protein
MTKKVTKAMFVDIGDSAGKVAGRGLEGEGARSPLSGRP